MNNLPQFKVNGQERKALKKELFELKTSIKDYWHYHNLDNDMAQIFDIPTKGNGKYPMGDQEAREIFDRTNDKIKKIEIALQIPYERT